jgi:hypothetical protein
MIAAITKLNFSTEELQPRPDSFINKPLLNLLRSSSIIIQESVLLVSERMKKVSIEKKSYVSRG